MSPHFFFFKSVVTSVEYCFIISGCPVVLAVPRTMLHIHCEKRLPIFWFSFLICENILYKNLKMSSFSQQKPDVSQSWWAVLYFVFKQFQLTTSQVEVIGDFLVTKHQIDFPENLRQSSCDVHSSHGRPLLLRLPPDVTCLLTLQRSLFGLIWISHSLLHCSLEQKSLSNSTVYHLRPGSLSLLYVRLQTWNQNPSSIYILTEGFIFISSSP